MEALSTTYAKAVDDLSAKIFIPALISSLLVEFGPWIGQKTGFGLILTYLIVLAIGAISATAIIVSIVAISIWVCGGKDIGPEIGVAIMPLGFAGLFPEQFSGLSIPYRKLLVSQFLRGHLCS